MNSLTQDRKASLTCELVDNETLLKQIPFFEKLPINVLKVLAYLSMQKTFKAGDYLFYQNDDDGQGIFIICGKACLEYAYTCAKLREAAFLVREIADGDFIGGLALLGKMRRLFSMKAITRLDCLILTRDKFAAAMGQFPELMPSVLQATVENVRQWEERCVAKHVCSSEKCIDYFDVSLL